MELARDYKDLDPSAKEILAAAVEFTWNVIVDFRLKDLKRRKTWTAAEER